MNKKGEIKNKLLLGIIISSIVLLNLLLCVKFIIAADPQGPDIVNVTDNETFTPPGAKIVNISGGYIATINLTATIQNPRWKAFIGQVIGTFTLDDQSGSTIYDWTLTSVTGRVYATRNSTGPDWSLINCSNVTTLTQENVNINHTNVNDNLTATFNISSGATHSAFYVGARYMPENTCPTLNTYKNNATQDTDFEEMALSDGSNIVFATILEENMVGFDGTNYDFQMIVPEIGYTGFNGATAYYLYVEIGT